jgi:tripartite-type tricarboxylate transporter receptor subunit TctC
MKIRFSFRLSAVLLLGLLLPFASSVAQGYPDRPVRIVVAYAPGGVVDIVARLVAAKLGPAIGGNVIVENIAGASGLLGTAHVARAAPDGYTLSMINSSTLVLGPLLFKNVTYDPIKDFAPIAQVSAAPTILVVPPSLPVKSLADLVALAKKDPNGLNYASFGRGGVAHLAAELFQLVTETKMTHVPYKGSGPAIFDMIGGSVKLDVFFDSIPSALPYVQDGRLRALAVTGKTRSPAAPEVPTIAESFPGFDVSVWQGLAAPAGTSTEIVAKLHGGLKMVMADPELQAKMASLGAEAMATSPEETAKYIKSERDRWARILDQIGLKPE